MLVVNIGSLASASTRFCEDSFSIFINDLTLHIASEVLRHEVK